MNDWPETSESLILRAKDPADAAAWSAFLAIYRPVIYRLVRRLLEMAFEDREWNLFSRIEGDCGTIAIAWWRANGA